MRARPGLQDRAGILIVVMFCAGVLTALWHFRNAQLDDAFITYRFARNLAAGLGFTYNPPEQVFGTTTPLYTFLLAIAGVLKLDIPAASLLINGLAICALAAAVYLASEPGRNTWGALLTALFVGLLPGTYTVLGMETLPYAALIYSGLYLLGREKFTGAAVIAAIAVLTRYDGLIFAGVLFLQELAVRRRLPWWDGVLFLGLLVPWLAYALLTFGSLLPVTFYAKTGLGGSMFLENFGENIFSLAFFTRLPDVMSIVLYILLGAAIAGLLVFKKGGALRPLLLWIAFYVLAYSWLGLRYAQHWYYYPLLPGLLLLTGYVFRRLLAVIDRRFVSNARLGWLVKRCLLAIGLLPLALTTFWGMINLWTRVDQVAELGGRYRVYRMAALWMCANDQIGDSIAVPEIGIFGWFCDRRIIDPYGLVTPEMLPYIQSDERLRGLALLEPDVIVIQNYPKDTKIVFPDAESFQDEYHPIKTFTDPDFPQVVVIFARAP